MIADSTGATVWRWDQQESFDNDVPNGDPGNAGVTFDFPLRFPGQYADKETGLAYNVMRDYDLGIGRYIESDRIGLAGGINTYTYTRNQPTKYTDPKGQFVEFIPIGIGSTACSTTNAHRALRSGAYVAAMSNFRSSGQSRNQRVTINHPGGCRSPTR